MIGSSEWILLLFAGVFLLPAGFVTCYENTEIKNVFVVFSNHFDMGYTKNEDGSCAGAVLNQYFHNHFPQAIKTAKEARRHGKFEYKWMTQSWIAAAYRLCNDTKVNRHGPSEKSDLICPSEEDLAEFEKAVKLGDINWHAFPFNGEPELFSKELFDGALNLTFAEDDFYGLPHRITYSQRDVPGLTRAAIPLLNERKVMAVSVGENLQCAPVNVPPIFLWKDVESDTEVVALFHAAGYGRRRRLEEAWGSENVVDSANVECKYAENPDCVLDENTRFYEDLNGNIIEKPSAHDDPSMYVGEDGKLVASAEHCVEVPEARAAICYAWKSDNMGPHFYWEAELIYDFVSLLYPSAKVVASNGFDDFIMAVLPFKDSLPVVTQEIGDSWIFGATSDPLKVALFRAASRAYSKCVRFGMKECLDDESNMSMKSLRNFERLLMTIGEHTWGYDGIGVKRRSWSNKELQHSLATDKVFQDTVETWREQRSFLHNALAALPPGSPLSTMVKKEFDGVMGYNNQEFNTNGFNHVEASSLSCGLFSLKFGKDGSIISLSTPVAKYDWASDTNPLFRVWYQNMDHKYFERFADDYVYSVSRLFVDLFAENLVKPNLKLKAINSNVTMTNLLSKGDNEVIVEMKINSHEAHTERGAPIKFQTHYVCFGGSEIEVSLRWFGKTATHAPETIWLTNFPAISPTKVTIDKLGSDVDALDADLGCDGHTYTCGAHLHGIGDRGIVYQSGWQSIQVIPLDNSVVSIGSLDPVPTPLVKPDINKGFHFPLVGNIWNTNYPFWYPFDDNDTSSQFRFKLLFKNRRPSSEEIPDEQSY